MSLRSLMPAVLLFAGVAFGDTVADRARLIGKWQQDDPAGKAVWVLESKGDNLQITHSDGAQKPSEYVCNTMGRECTVQDAGKKVHLSLWYSGPKLVEMETRGSDVLKRRFAVSANGDTMEVEVIPIVPAGKTEVLHFKRLQLSADGR